VKTEKGDFAMTGRPLHETIFGSLPTSVYSSNEELGQAAALEAASVISGAISHRGEANIILATGNSQLSFLAALGEMREISWSAVNVFHMDEYVGIDPAHSASFPLFLREHLIDRVRPKSFHPVPNSGTEADCRAYETLLRAHPADLCALGFGENGHLAFNDPPWAKFADLVWVKIVQLDERSRRQQVGEGHFASLGDVPTHATTLTIPALLSAARILAIVPEARKAEAVARALLGPISEDCPASILRRATQARLYLDAESAQRLKLE
jgi:glucosamine-6-phosphate deaminase